MGSIGSGPRLAAFQSDTFATGLDLRRSEINRNLGVHKAKDTAIIRQGQLVALDANQELILAVSNNVMGVAKHNKMLLGKSLAVDEAVVLTGTIASNLKRANVSNISVRSAPGMAGTQFLPIADYTENDTNGTITRNGAGAIVSGSTVYVTYTFDMTQNDYQQQGLNFFGNNDDATTAAGRLTLVEGPALLFTTEFDTSRQYTLTGAGASLYCGGATPALAGLFTNNPAEGRYVGRVRQLPSASDPFMGIEFTGHPEEE
jgi:hypothetical protein